MDTAFQLIAGFGATLVIAFLLVYVVMRLTMKIYVPPVAEANDFKSDVATVTVKGLIPAFQLLVVTGTVLGLFVFGWRYLPVPLSSDAQTMLSYHGVDAVALPLAILINLVLQPIWIVSAFGLCCFTWWSRPLFVGAYILGFIQTLLGGVAVLLPWEFVLLTFISLVDGAVLALAFLPPLSGYFDREKR